MNRNIKIVIQGVAGCFHEEAARAFFGHNRLEIIEADTFEVLAQKVKGDHDIHYGIMAIENSIAGSLLQNYRLLRENNFWISGEVFLRIEHHLMALPGQELEDIKEIASHPMALNQCVEFLRGVDNVRRIEMQDTALSAKEIKESSIKNRAAIASKTAAELYGLEVLAEGIETSKNNYTRFFIISRESQFSSIGNADKASIYLRVPDNSGALLKVLEAIAEQEINISKLQSYPVLNEINQYYFHLDLEFDHLQKYEDAIENLKEITLALDELGIYKKAAIYDHLSV